MSMGRDELWNTLNNQTLQFITSCNFILAPCGTFVNLDGLMCFSSSYGPYLDISLTISASIFGCKIAQDTTQWLFPVISMTPTIFDCYFCPITDIFLIKYVLGESNSKGKCDDFFHTLWPAVNAQMVLGSRGLCCQPLATLMRTFPVHQG